MKMTELVADGAISPQLKSDSRDDVLAELIDTLVAAGAATADIRDELLQAVIQREERGSTGFGKGVAVPHVKHDAVTAMTAAVGVSQNGVDFNALDKQPVYSFILLLSPAASPDEHLQAMETIFKNLSQETFRRFLRQATTTQDIVTLLEETDAHHLPG